MELFFHNFTEIIAFPFPNRIELLASSCIIKKENASTMKYLDNEGEKDYVEM